MHEIYPNYYHKFKCIADKCRHSCCIGWEIDIDEDTSKLYNSLSGEIGTRIRENIEGEPPHFILGDGERCPFLNKCGLCDIILKCGEDALCDICTLHPRFKNFYDEFEEVGLGLCCEEAARIILSFEDKVKLDVPHNLSVEEKFFFAKRQEIFDVLQDREKTILERFKALCKDFNISTDELYDIYINLERLDKAWDNELIKLKAGSFSGKIFEKFPIVFEQLAVYFIFRHLTEALYDGEYDEKIKFAYVSCYLIAAICEISGDLSFEKISDIARMYSSEIEYSEENTKEIMERI